MYWICIQYVLDMYENLSNIGYNENSTFLSFFGKNKKDFKILKKNKKGTILGFGIKNDYKCINIYIDRCEI